MHFPRPQFLFARAPPVYCCAVLQEQRRLLPRFRGTKSGGYGPLSSPSSAIFSVSEDFSSARRRNNAHSCDSRYSWFARLSARQRLIPQPMRAVGGGAHALVVAGFVDLVVAVAPV